MFFTVVHFFVMIFPCLDLAPTPGYGGREEEMDRFSTHPLNPVKVCLRQRCDTQSPFLGKPSVDKIRRLKVTRGPSLSL